MSLNQRQRHPLALLRSCVAAGRRLALPTSRRGAAAILKGPPCGQYLAALPPLCGFGSVLNDGWHLAFALASPLGITFSTTDFGVHRSRLLRPYFSVVTAHSMFASLFLFFLCWRPIYRVYLPLH